MKNVGIVTLGGYFNYGNRLQNAALVFILKDKLHMNVSTILNWGNSKKVYNIKGIRGIAGFIKHVGVNYFIKKERLDNFIKFSDSFSSEYIIDKVVDSYHIPSSKFDYIVVGSDQVWANWLTPREMEYFTLSDVPNYKRISYAASMGNPSLSKASKSIFDNEMKKFSHISVREYAAQKYIANIVGSKVPVVLDPTLLLSDKDWMSMLSKLDNPFSNKSNKYIFTYFLSEPSDKMKKVMKDLKEQGYDFVNFNSKKINSRKYYGLGPEDFVFAVSSSDGVLTDSFHASVFSILFKKPFYIDPNRFGGSMSSRIDTLLEITELKSRELNNYVNLNEFSKIDYSNAVENLNKLKLDSINYLKEALEG